MLPINGAIERNIPEDSDVNRALEDEERPLPNVKGLTRFILGIWELVFTLFASFLPNWETRIYIKVVYHKMFKNTIKSWHPKPEEADPIEDKQAGEEIKENQVDQAVEENEVADN